MVVNFEPMPQNNGVRAFSIIITCQGQFEKALEQNSEI
jgi:hypothetical protein